MHAKFTSLIKSDDLNSYFNLTEAKYFLRQINGYGFQRVSKGSEKGSYYHEVRWTSKFSPANYSRILDLHV